MSAVTVIGLGPMGSALAQALLVAGHEVTVWNRSRGPAEALVSAGASEAKDLGTAVSASPLVIVCVRDHGAVRSLLDQDGLELDRATIVNLSSTTPVEARETAAWASSKSIAYLGGAILVPTPQVGDPEALLLYSGDRGVFDRHSVVLRALGGDTRYLGEDAGLAPLYDVAMLGIFFTGMTSFLHSAALLQANGVSARDFVPLAEWSNRIVADVVPFLARDVDAREYPGDEDTLAMNLTAVTHIVESSQASGVDSSLYTAMLTLGRKAMERGNELHGYSSLIEAMRADVADAA